MHTVDSEVSGGLSSSARESYNQLSQLSICEKIHVCCAKPLPHLGHYFWVQTAHTWTYALLDSASTTQLCYPRK